MQSFLLVCIVGFSHALSNKKKKKLAEKQGRTCECGATTILGEMQRETVHAKLDKT